MRLENYVNGRWQHGEGEGTPLYDPTTGEELARASAEGVDFETTLDYARTVGGPSLRRLGYAERAGMLKAVADVLTANRERYYEISRKNSGATDADAAFDVDGGIGTVKFYAGAGRQLGDARYLLEAGSERLGKDERFQTAHLWTPLTGVAVHVNAFNFPSWGLWEKAAVALLNGVPVLAKPATATAWLSYQMVRDVIEAGCLPEGALSLVCGSARGLVDSVRPGDVVAFTGSADTAAELRATPAVLAAGVPFNVEADSLNAAVLGPEAGPETPEFDALVREVRREMTVKAGQKCTAIRRILVPAEHIDAVEAALIDKLGAVAVGDPRNESVRVGPLVNRAQQQAAWAGLDRLTAEATPVFGGSTDFTLVDADPATGCFFPPTLLRCDYPVAARAVHEVEVFGPVATLMPYRDADEAFELVARGSGSLVASVFSADAAFCAQAATVLGPWHGRLALIDGEMAAASPGHGTVMPQCVHGGPGRAGGGEELGGLRALRFYHQRTALQASVDRIEALREGASPYQP